MAVVSLYPLNDLGGGERYTFCVAKAIQAAGDTCELFARSERGPAVLPPKERLAIPFTRFVADRLRAETLSFRDVLSKLHDFDVVWVHQFLSSDVVFDLIAGVTSDQMLLFTNLGHEPLASSFRAFYCQSRNHHFIEISDYSATRSGVFGRQSIGIAAAVWKDDVTWDAAPSGTPKIAKITAVGRVLPHKGIDVTVAALPPDWELDVVGPVDDKQYSEHLRKLALGKKVCFTGPVSDEVKRRRIVNSLCLVASSCHLLYDGRHIVQAELLGLVIFESCALNRIPVTSDIPSFSEVMSKIGLDEYVYPARDIASLKSKLFKAFTETERHADLLERAKARIRQEYLWDDYWKRVTSSVLS